MGLDACELFAGVGGFRLGLQNGNWNVKWANQWEPGNRAQWAFKCYESRFGEDREHHTNGDISKVPAKSIPDHQLLVGGFPCQDYSVATTQAEGIHGRKGVLWWEIKRILNVKRPPFVLLENVDRLLRSPTNRRGRDFGVMLRCLADLGYHAEWRVINSGDYGAPQRRRRTFIVATQSQTDLGESMESTEDPASWMVADGFFAKAFPVVPYQVKPLDSQPQKRLPDGLQATSDRFQFEFQNTGYMVDGAIWTTRTKPDPEPVVRLDQILQRNVDERFFVPDADVEKWKRLKGAKDLKRKAANGHVYFYSEGAIPFPDRLDAPSRTLITSEGGLTPSRFKHIVEDPQQPGRYRVLTPVEAELLNQFPKDWTNTGMPERWRYFTMGNALVVGMVDRMGKVLAKWAEKPVGRKRAQSVRVRV